MTRLGTAWLAVVLTISGALAGAAITFRWFSQQIEKAVTL